MTVHASWPKLANERYEVTIKARNSSADATAESDEFGRFEKLAHGLVAVPKSELDERLDQSAPSG